MNGWFKKCKTMCAFAFIFSANSLFAQLPDYLIEHGREVSQTITGWGDTYVGKYTSGNALYVWSWVAGGETNDAMLTSYDAFIGGTDFASGNLAWVSANGAGSNAQWSVKSLQIGSANNSNNRVFIDDYGTLEVSSNFNVLGAANGNSLSVSNNGTFYIKSDFDATMDGFDFGEGGTLKVGGVLTGIDILNGQKNVIISGEGSGTNATWHFGTDTLYIGDLSSSNSVLVEQGSLVNIDNLVLGGAGTISNRFSVSENAQAIVSGTVNIDNPSQNILSVSNNGILTFESDFDATMAGFLLTTGGVLEARANLIMTNLDHTASILMNGTNANWSNLSGSQLHVGGSTDGNILSISNGATVYVDNILIGGATNTENVVSITDGGSLILTGSGGGIDLVGTNNNIRVIDGGRLVFESDYYFNPGDVDSSFSWGSKGILEFQGKAVNFINWGSSRDENGHYVVGGYHFLQSQQILVLNGSGAYFDPISDYPLAYHPLHIGDLSWGNEFIVTNGAYARVDYLTIGAFKDGGHDNLLTITGTNSIFDVEGDIALGGEVLGGYWLNGGTGNTIRVENGGLLHSIAGNLYNLNAGGNGVELGTGGKIEVGSYYQGAGSYLNFLIDQDGLTNAGRLVARDVAWFDDGAEFRFNNVGDLVFSQLYTNLIVEAPILIVGGVTNATTEDLSVLVTTNSSLLHAVLSVENNGIWAVFNRQYLADASGFLPGTMMSDVANEIDLLSLSGSSAASNMVNVLNGMSNNVVNAQLRQLYEYNAPTYMHGRAIYDGAGLTMNRCSAFRMMLAERSRKKPSGAHGPHVKDQGLRGWATGYGNLGSYDAGGSGSIADGYDMQVYGTVIGLDKSFGGLLLGIAGGYAGSALETDGGDESDGTSGYGIFYASVGTFEWFGDLVASYGTIDIENRSGTAFDITSDVAATQGSIYVGFGKEWALKNLDAARLGWRFRPQVGLRVGLYDQDAYTESSDTTNAVGKVVDAYDRMSYLSTVGGSLMMPKSYKRIGFETELRAAWMHEFNADVKNIGYSLSGGNDRYQFAMQSPEEDMLDLGLSVKAVWLNGLEARVALDGQIGSDYKATTLSGSLLYNF